MKQEPAAGALDPSEEIAALVRTLHDTQRRLQELTGGQIDAVLHPDGQSYLLHDAQEKLRLSGEALRTSENALALGQQIAHLGSWELELHDVLDLEATPVRWSDEMFRIAGYEPGSVAITMGLFFSFIPEEDRTSLRQAIATAVREKKQYTVSHRLIRPDGEQRFVQQMGQIFVSDVGGPIKISGTAHDITAQLKSAHQLSLLYTCVAKLNDVVLITEAEPIDPPGPKIVFVNEAFERITGYKAEEAIGKNPRFLQGEKTEQKVLSEIREALVLKQPIKRQILNYDKHGKEYWIEVEIVPVFNDAGKCTHFVAIESDVTEDKRIKEQLAWRTAMFEAQIHSSLDGILIVNSADRKILQNQRMIDLWEIPSEIAANIDDLSQFEWVSRKVKDPKEFLEKSAFLKLHPDQISREEIELLSGRTLDRYSAPVRGKDGKYYGRIWIFRDITERKRADAALHLQSERLELATHSAGIGIWDWNIQKDELVWDDRMQALYGLKSGDFSGVYEAWLNGLHPDDRDNVNEVLMKAVRGEGEYDTEFRVLWPDGSTHVIKANGHVLRDEEGQPLRMIGINYDITERKRSESRFRRLVDSNAQGVMFWKGSGEITDGNDAFLRLIGYSQEDLKSGRINWRELTPQEYDEADHRALQEIAAHGFCDPVEKEWIRKDGTRVPVYLTAARFEDAPDRGVTFALDLTDRKLAERAQRLSEERFSHAFEYAPNGMIIIAPNGKVITANRTMCDLLGYSLEEITRKGLEEITHPEDVPKELERVRSVFASEVNVYQIEKRYLHKDGHEIWAQVSSSLVRDAKHEPLYFIKQVQDITAMKRAYQQIEEQAALIDEASDAIISRDLEQRVMFWNKGAERLYGWTAEEAMGQNAKDLLKLDPAKFIEADKALRETGHWNGELQKQSKAGIPLTINTRWTLLRGAHGQPRSILTIDTDITERRKLEQQFLRAQRMESIGTLAGGIAHDLNNILAPIMMSIDVLKSISDKPEAMEILETIRVSAKRGADIVRQVLSFARGVEGKKIEVQPKHILEDVENIVKNTFPKSVEVRTTIPRDTWTILGDPTQIHQILLNLCVNARDAMPNGGKLTLTVENFVLDNQYSVMSHEAKPGPYVQISVTDSGTGIPPQLLERIFEPFFTTKEVTKGTGLGLSTVMAIVKSHEGTINVYSELGKGTTFKVYLPALESSPEKRKVQTQRVSLPRGNGETILVVDDEASILTITCQTLLAFGYRVLKAADGAEAVALYARHEHEVAVVLTDMMMPVLDGCALIHALKRINPAVKIIAASGLNAEGNVAKVTEAGVNHFLTKPYTAGTLLKTLQEIVNET